MDKPDIQAAPLPDGGMMPSYCTMLLISARECENGMIYPMSNQFPLIGDTIVQCSADSSDDGCVPADAACAKKIEGAEASTEYPYILKKDLTVNCKEMYKMELDTGHFIPEGFNWSSYGGYERVRCTSYYLCEDGNSYESEDMLQDE